MPFLNRPQPAQAEPRPRIGVLLVNLGTPQAPTARALKPYLRQFLSDPRVVEIPKLLWQPLLRGVILNTRPGKSAAKYASIWHKDGSPLALWTAKQAKLVKGWLGERHRGQLRVEYAMRYGQPAITEVLDAMDDCGRILVVPLYPQYAASATASVCDAVYARLQQYRDQPAIRTVRSFHDDAGYIGALAGRIRQHWMVEGRGEHLLMSFHGVPRFSFDKGDPYYLQCQRTGSLLAAELGLTDDAWSLAFQSRFGPTEWLKPYTGEVIGSLAKRGLKSLDVVCPGFVADCLETLEEIAMEGKQDFLAVGGQRYNYIPALNDDAGFIAALGALIERELGGWLTIG
ncbi:ferrochelatase [Chitinolyticbacter meiyuanensis]|uniref:ferrochelatase n=1 Tax=Chitinolyticbacter meiyuanensis TaxID=682798 RepID=UPI0011E5A503|nr:ferrochelatase [Chitinolyticbacter meiyuanensis]